MPALRWGSHFSTGGSFRVALSTMDCELMESNAEVSFYAFYCQELHNCCREVELRRTTQFLEHLLHVETIAHPVLGIRFELISETKRTAPSYCNFPKIEELAREIVSHVAMHISRA